MKYNVWNIIIFNWNAYHFDLDCVIFDCKFFFWSHNNFFFLPCKTFCSWQKDTHVTLIVWPKGKENGTKGKPLESLTKGGKCSQNCFFFGIQMHLFCSQKFFFVWNSYFWVECITFWSRLYIDCNFFIRSHKTFKANFCFLNINFCLLCRKFCTQHKDTNLPP